ncbi:MAG: GspE/PulE family protein [Dehalococcoidales bacterium]|jgi:general secretion pathway protein E
MQRNKSLPTDRLIIEEEVTNYLKKQGYQVTKAAKVTGQSGVEHIFDMLAEADEYLVHNIIAIAFALNGQKSGIGNIIFDFSNKAYDAGINQRILVVDEETDNKIKALARQKRIKIFDIAQIGTFAQAPAHPPESGTKENVNIESMEQLALSLTRHGYRVREKARVTGRSGVDYTFDILCYHDIDNFGYSIGIDFPEGAAGINLDQVSLFDTKAYDAGTDYKVLAVKSKLNAEAAKFAAQQHIQICQINSETANAPAPPVNADEAVKPAAARSGPLFCLPDALRLIPEIIARRYNAVPLAVSGNELEVAMEDPTNMLARESMATISQKQIKPVIAGKKEIRDAIDLNYRDYSEIERQITHIHIPTGSIDDGILASKIASYTPVVEALNAIIEGAGRARASDIHLEPGENRFRVRYRIDGELQDMISLPLNIHRAIISRTKVLAGMNIADSRRPQDGQFTTTVKGRPLDVRVSTTPTIYGETAVLRILDKSLALFELSELGFMPEALDKYEKMLKVPFGMILISGPTGSGKTTTLYASVNSLDSMKRKIITVEDPAEYRLKDITQIQVNPQAGITFATGLRSILRLDPDIIFIGEIRDGETANIAVQAAQTGHVVLSSIHASDTAGVLSRLVDLKIEPFMIASSVVGIVSQRLVRRLCPHCQHEIEATALEQIAYEEETGERRIKFRFGIGCKLCSYTGYQGRIGIYEVLLMSTTLKTMLYHQATTDELRGQALKEGMVTMLNDGMNKVKLGITTPGEVIRAAYTAGMDK